MYPTPSVIAYNTMGMMHLKIMKYQYLFIFYIIYM